MKINIIIAAFFVSILANAQVKIGGTGEVTNPSVILEFDTEPRGLILPWVTSVNDMNASEGTLAFDTSDQKVKLKNGPTTWLELGGEEAGSVDASMQASKDDTNNGGVIIGSNTSTAEGVLVLESADKVMILPKVANPELNIENPAPGMMTYDPDNDVLSIFNGSKWIYWGESLGAN